MVNIMALTEPSIAVEDRHEISSLGILPSNTRQFPVDSCSSVKSFAKTVVHTAASYGFDTKGESLITEAPVDRPPFMKL